MSEVYIEEPLVSIVIPVYNEEQYLTECLDSVVHQTLRDIEIVCVNDGSTDSSPEILERYAAKDDRIRVVHKENGGLSSARNAAFPLIRSKYTLFVDSDDTIHPEMCEQARNIAESEHSDMVIFFAEMSGHWAWATRLAEKKITNNEASQVDRTVLIQFCTACLKLWRTDFLLKNDLTFPEGLYHEDVPFYWKSLLCDPRIAFLPKRMYYYRVHSKSIMSNPSLKTAKDVLTGFELIKESLLAKGLYQDEWKSLFLEQKLRSFRIQYYRVSCNNRSEFVKSMKDHIGPDEKNYIVCSKQLPGYVKDFYRALDGSRIAQMKCWFWASCRAICKMYHDYKFIFIEKIKKICFQLVH